MKIRKILLVIFSFLFFFILNMNDAKADFGHNGYGLIIPGGNTVSGEYGLVHEDYTGIRLTLVDSDGERVNGTITVDYWAGDKNPANFYNAIMLENSTYKTEYINSSGNKLQNKGFEAYNMPISEEWRVGNAGYFNWNNRDNRLFEAMEKTIVSEKKCVTTTFLNDLKFNLCEEFKDKCVDLKKYYLLIEPLIFININGHDIVVTATEYGYLIDLYRNTYLSNSGDKDIVWDLRGDKGYGKYVITGMFLSKLDKTDNKDYDIKANKSVYTIPTDIEAKNYSEYDESVQKGVYGASPTQYPMGYGMQLIWLGKLNVDCDDTPACCVPCDPNDTACIENAGDNFNPNDPYCCLLTGKDEQIALGYDDKGNLVCGPADDYWNTHDIPEYCMEKCVPPANDPTYCCDDPIWQKENPKDYEIYCTEPDSCRPLRVEPEAETKVCDTDGDSSNDISYFRDGVFNSQGGQLREYNTTENFKKLNSTSTLETILKNAVSQYTDNSFLAVVNSDDDYYKTTYEDAPSFCNTAYCQEVVAIQLPTNVPYAEAGRYFTWSIKDTDKIITQTTSKICVQNIDLNSFIDNYMSIVNKAREIVKKVNKFCYYDDCGSPSTVVNGKATVTDCVSASISKCTSECISNNQGENCSSTCCKDGKCSDGTCQSACSARNAEKAKIRAACPSLCALNIPTYTEACIGYENNYSSYIKGEKIKDDTSNNTTNGITISQDSFVAISKEACKQQCILDKKGDDCKTACENEENVKKYIETYTKTFLNKKTEGTYEPKKNEDIKKNLTGSISEKVEKYDELNEANKKSVDKITSDAKKIIIDESENESIEFTTTFASEVEELGKNLEKCQQVGITVGDAKNDNSQLNVDLSYQTFIEERQFNTPNDFIVETNDDDSFETSASKCYYTTNECNKNNVFGIAYLPINLDLKSDLNGCSSIGSGNWNSQKFGNTSYDEYNILYSKNNTFRNLYSATGYWLNWNPDGTLKDYEWKGLATYSLEDKIWKSARVFVDVETTEYRLKDSINACVCLDGTIEDADENGKCSCDSVKTYTEYEITYSEYGEYYCKVEWESKTYYKIPEGNLKVGFMNPSGYYPLALDYSNIGTKGHFSELIIANKFSDIEHCDLVTGTCHYSDTGNVCYLELKNKVLIDNGEVEDSICPDGECPPPPPPCSDPPCKLDNICKDGECKVGGLEIIYRQVDLDNPFPDRNPGGNWMNEENNLTEIITNNRGVEGNKLYSSNLEPLYSVTMTPAIIKEIRKVNAALNYDYASEATMIYGDNNTNNADSNGDSNIYGVSVVLRNEIQKITVKHKENFTINLDGDDRFTAIIEIADDGLNCSIDGVTE